MSTKFLSPGWRMPRNANQSKSSNYSIDFNGSSQYLDLGDDDIFSFGNSTDDSPFSISAWIYMNDATSFRILNKYNAPNYEYQFDLSSSDKLQFYIFDGSNYRGVGYDSALSINQWYHVVATYDGRGGSSAQSGMVLYVNGSPVNDITYSSGSYTAMHNTTAPVNIGRIASSYANGKIDAVSIFDYALSSSQVTTLYGTGSAIGNPMALPSPPIAYYPLGTSAWNGQYLAENNAIGDYVFDFANSNIEVDSIGSLFSGITNFSFSGWFNLTSFGGQQVFNILEGNNWKFGINTFNNQLRFNINPGVAYITNLQNITSTNTWFHYAGVFDGSGASDTDRLKLYINGQPQTVTYATTTPASFPTLASTANISIGGTLSPFNGMTGKSSNIQLWTSSLTPSEVETLYNYGSPIKTLANIPQSSNLKAWYKLDASEVYNNTTTEWSIDNNQNPSDYPSSLDFGTYTSNDRIIINNTFDTIITGTNFTISSWVNLNSVTSSQLKFIFTNESLQFVITDKITTYLRGASGYFLSPFSGNTTLTTGKWYNVVLVKSGSDYTYYLNGSPDGTVNNSTAVVNSSQTTSRIGMFFQNNTYGFDGKLSNVQIFNSALPATGSNSIETLYNNGSPLASMSGFTSLVSWWKLNNTTTGIEDAKGSNNGTNNGATEYPGFVNTLAGDSSGMSQANLIQSDLQTVAPYSKYAMNFDSADSDNIIVNSNTGLNFGTGDFTYSLWGKINTTASNPGFYGGGSGNNNPSANSGYLSIGVHISQPTGYVGATRCWISGEVFNGTTIITDNNWHNIVLTRTSGVVQIYLDGNIEVMRDSSGTVVTNPTSSNSITNTNGISIGSFRTNANYINGSMSNCSIWNTALTSAQVTEIYNEGLPSDLNSHSAYSNLVSWWQLGENSSYTGDWIFADEKGTNNGEGQNLTEINLTNGVGTTANGVSSGMSEGNLVGDAPYSTANAISTNMIVTSRVSGSGNTP